MLGVIGDWLSSVAAIRAQETTRIARKNVRWRLSLGSIQTNPFDKSCRSFTPGWPNGTVAACTEDMPGAHENAGNAERRQGVAAPRN